MEKSLRFCGAEGLTFSGIRNGEVCHGRSLSSPEMRERNGGDKH